MKVSKNVVVSIAYQVRTEDGVLVDEAPANQPLQYLQGHNNLVIGLENALEGKSVGDKFEVRVKPEEGYGEYNENMVQRVPKDVFVGVDELTVGMRFIADTDMGPLPVVITEVGDNDVVVDGNHMLPAKNYTLLWKWSIPAKQRWKKLHTVICTKKAAVVAVMIMIAMKQDTLAVAVTTITIITTTLITMKVAVAVMIMITSTTITTEVVAVVAANTKNINKKDRTSMRSFVFMSIYLFCTCLF